MPEPAAPDFIPWVNPQSGKVEKLHPEDAALAKSQGWLPPSPEQLSQFQAEQKYGGVAGGIRAFGAGTLAGIANATPEQAPGGSPEVTAAHPKLTAAGQTTGQIAQGVAASAVLGGLGIGGAAAGRAAAGAIPSAGVDTFGQHLARTVVQRAVEGGVEGGIFGGTHVVHEAALGDPNLTAQSVMSELGLSVLFGAGGGALFGAAEGALPTATAKAKAALSGVLQRGKSPELLSAISGAPRDDVATYIGLAEKGVDPEAIRASAPELAERMQASVDAVSDAHGLANRELRPAESRGLLESRKAVNVESDLVAAQEQIGRTVDDGGRLLMKLKAQPELYSPAVTKQLENGLANFTTALDGVKEPADLFAAQDKFKQFLQKGLSYGEFGSRGPAEQAAQAEIKGFTRGVRLALEDEKVWGPAGARQAAFNSAQSDYISAAKGLNQFWGRKLRADGSVVMDPAKFAAAARGDPATKQLAMEAMDDWHSASAKYVDEIGKSAQATHVPTSQLDRESLLDLVNASGKTAETLRDAQRFKQLSGQLGGGPSFGGVGDIGAIGLGHMIGGPVGGAIGAGVRALQHIKSVPQAVATLTKLQGINAKVGGLIERGVAKIFSGSPKTAEGAVGAEAADLFEKRAAKVSALVDPTALTARVGKATESLAAHAPATAQSVATAQSAAAVYLAGLLPQHQLPGIKAPAWKPTPEEIQRFNSAWEALDKPLSLLDKARDGSLLAEDVRAVSTVYPALYGKVQAHASMKLSGFKGPIPMRAQVGLSKLIGAPATPSVSPGYGLAAQGVYAMPTPAMAPPGGGGSRGSPAAGKVTLSTRIQTPLQQAAGRKP